MIVGSIEAFEFSKGANVVWHIAWHVGYPNLAELLDIDISHRMDKPCQEVLKVVVARLLKMR